jgi:hypothetical protein
MTKGGVKIVIKISLLTILALLFMIQGRSGSCRSNKVSNTPDEKIERVSIGVWGGEHIQMQVTESGAQIEYDCAHGAIEQQLVLDGKGNFDVTGAHVRERGGPVRMGDTTRSRPARFTGSVNGKTMTLTVTLTDKQQRLDTYTLTQGASGRIRKCR